MAELFNRLSVIGRLNKDAFEVDVQPLDRDGRIVWRVRVRETADLHEFIWRVDERLHFAIQKTLDGLPGACAEWGYQSMSPNTKGSE